MGRLPQRQRVAAYAVIIRDGRILMSRLAARVTSEELWTLPGGGIDHGEDPRDAVIREVREETGLVATVSREARVYSMHNRRARFGKGKADYHALRIVFEGWVAADAPEPRVVEVDGSTAEAAWLPLAEVLSGAVPTTSLVLEALRDHEHNRHQRLAAYAVVLRSDEVLLTRLSARAHLPGVWTLPGGGIEHGERPADGLAREVEEECGVTCEVGPLLDVHDVHLVGTAPDGRTQDYHGVHLLYAATVAGDTPPRVVEVDGTTDAVEWVPVAEVLEGRREVLDVVRHALSLAVTG
ncbi:NUDIX hydrolase [Nocardioides jiangxiensis]|uniref:NUDIX domain-containing protein n=1 Tax=Nocardioides jiangxiensis TaxID=3064524 RepID=A0ABT9B006_9ACTN|nr:NUDIX domain-containing protein [Nocardioides sp. WY-20]MDO7867720.1 NUDIX domain-containing protein [Nocardioides sp. WY-20]